MEAEPVNIGSIPRGQPRFKAIALTDNVPLVTAWGDDTAYGDIFAEQLLNVLHALADHIRAGREYGKDGHYGSDFAGLNARMPEFNAILGLKSLEMLEENAKRRNRVVERFREQLE